MATLTAPIPSSIMSELKPISFQIPQIKTLEDFYLFCQDNLLSATDSLKAAKTKMEDVWMANGCGLAWLIDPKTETSHISRANAEIQIVGFDKLLSGEGVLVGFELKL